MALTMTPGTGATPPFDGVDNGQKLVYIYGTIVASGNYTTGGDTLDFTTLFDLVKTDYIPVQVTAWSQSSASGHSGYSYYWRPGSALNNGRIQVLTTGTGSGQPLVELAAGAYPAGITGDTIAFCAVFARV